MKWLLYLLPTSLLIGCQPDLDTPSPPSFQQEVHFTDTDPCWTVNGNWSSNGVVEAWLGPLGPAGSSSVWYRFRARLEAYYPDVGYQLRSLTQEYYDGYRLGPQGYCYDVAPSISGWSYFDLEWGTINPPYIDYSFTGNERYYLGWQITALEEHHNPNYVRLKMNKFDHCLQDLSHCWAGPEHSWVTSSGFYWTQEY